MATPPSAPDGISRLLEVMAKLRGGEGCPWDRVQTHRSLTPYLIEEAYELIEAIEAGSEDELRDELGDVLLQTVFHARIAEERGAFSFDDVAAAIADKLVTRHPHVFGGETLETAEQVRHRWHAQKMESRSSALEGVPSGQPALLWARQIGARAAHSGFEWEAADEIVDRAREELEELRQAMGSGGAPSSPEAMEEELGDLLFAITSLARWCRVDPEAALRRATRKFIGRFVRMENALHDKGERADAQTPGQWRALWREAKAADGD